MREKIWVRGVVSSGDINDADGISVAMLRTARVVLAVAAEDMLNSEARVVMQGTMTRRDVHLICLSLLTADAYRLCCV